MLDSSSLSLAPTGVTRTSRGGVDTTVTGLLHRLLSGHEAQTGCVRRSRATRTADESHGKTVTSVNFRVRRPGPRQTFSTLDQGPDRAGWPAPQSSLSVFRRRGQA